MLTRRLLSYITRTSNYKYSQSAQLKDETDIRPFSEMPEPKSYPLIGTSLDYGKSKEGLDLFSFWMERHKKLGPIFKENALPGITEMYVFCSSMEDTETMFRSEGKYPFRDGIGPITKIKRQLGSGLSLLDSNSKDWKRIRNEVNKHLLSNETVWQLTKAQFEVTQDFLKYIEKNLDENNEVPHFDKVLHKWTFEMTGLFALNKRLGAFEEKMNPQIRGMIKTNNILFHTSAEMLFGLPTWKIFNTKLLKQARDAYQFQEKVAFEHIENVVSRNIDVSQLKNLDSLLMGENLTKREKVAIMAEIFFAGIDTTSNSTVFVLYALSQNPKEQEKVRAEILEFLQSTSEITGKSLQKLKHLNACIKETQRMFPFIGSIARTYPQELVLSGYKIPANTCIVNISNVVNGRSPKYFDNPDEFLPQRWLRSKTAEEKKEDRFSMVGPFGFGGRMCPGRKFAMQELQIGIIGILSKYKVEYHHKPIVTRFRLASYPSEKPQFKFIPINTN